MARPAFYPVLQKVFPLVCVERANGTIFWLLDLAVASLFIKRVSTWNL